MHEHDIANVSLVFSYNDQLERKRQLEQQRNFLCVLSSPFFVLLCFLLLYCCFVVVFCEPLTNFRPVMFCSTSRLPSTPPTAPSVFVIAMCFARVILTNDRFCDHSRSAALRHHFPHTRCHRWESSPVH